MKRDLELIRSILLHLEGGSSNRHLPGAGTDVTVEHIRLLCEAGLLEASDNSTRGRTILVPERLTSAGHDFLDAVRNDDLWTELRRRMRERSITLTLGGLQRALTEASLAKLAA